jgi:glucokinase
MLLAGDVGGTKTLLGLFERADGGRPRPVVVRSYASTGYRSFTDILDAFAADVGRPFAIDAAAAGVAGPVIENRARLTNIPWEVSANDITTRFHTPHAVLLNDLEAMANGAEWLNPDEVVTLQHGQSVEDGNAVVIAAGTGLGEAYLQRVNGRLQPVPSEGGHADFAARTDPEIDLLRMLRAKYGRAEVEHVLSGPGLLNLYAFTHPIKECDAMKGVALEMSPSAISQSAMNATCVACVEALTMFVSAYGAEAGNLALRGLATAGVYVGGGIAPKILPALQNGPFMAAFRDKGAMSELVARMPVKVIVNPEVGLLGAAVAAANL